MNQKLRWLALVVMSAALVALVGCGSDGQDRVEAGGPSAVRLGYFPNLTHAPALIGIQEGLFAEELGSVALKASAFNAGPEVVEALFSDALDIAYLGPNPAINAYAKSQADGGAIRILAGSTSGGAALVVRDTIDSASDLKGRKIATPQLGNTQDVAARTWLKQQGLPLDGVTPMANADALAAFIAGDIDGAWVPEPWVSRLVLEGNGKVLLDEASLWPNGKFVTTHIAVRTEFLTAHPKEVEAILRGHLAALDVIANDPAAAQASANTAIEAATKKPLSAEVLARAWKGLSFTADPLSSTLRTSADHAVALELLDPVDLDGIYDLSLLNKLLEAMGKPKVSS